LSGSSTGSPDRFRLALAGAIAAGAHAVVVTLVPIADAPVRIVAAPALVFLEPSLERVEAASAPHGAETAVARKGSTAAESRRARSVGRHVASVEAARAPSPHAEPPEPTAADGTSSAVPALSVSASSDATSDRADAARTGAPLPAGVRGDGVPAARGTGHGPLLAAADPCRDLFPVQAEESAGVVTVAVSVAPTGRTSRARILEESPRGQGFARAAHACSSRLRFRPAIDPAGRPIAANSVVRLRFERND